MDKQLSMIGVWCGVAVLVLFLIAFVVFAEWMPPMSPSLNADEVARLFNDKATAIRCAGILMTLAAAAYLPFTVMITEIIKLNEKSNFLPATQLVAGVMSSFSFFIPGYLWVTATFRPDRNPEVTQALVDFAWLMFITPVAPFIIQYLCLGLAIFRDKSSAPLLPRWVGYLQVWISVSFVPAMMAFFMKTGPFAWDGIFVWWVPAIMFGVWFAIMIMFCRRVILSRSM